MREGEDEGEKSLPPRRQGLGWGEKAARRAAGNGLRPIRRIKQSTAGIALPLRPLTGQSGCRPRGRRTDSTIPAVTAPTIHRQCHSITPVPVRTATTARETTMNAAGPKIDFSHVAWYRPPKADQCCRGVTQGQEKQGRHGHRAVEGDESGEPRGKHEGGAGDFEPFIRLRATGPASAGRCGSTMAPGTEPDQGKD